MTNQAEYRAALEALEPSARAAYLGAHSGLPGPRANLELAQAVADAASATQIRSLAASTDEYEALCGAVGLGRLLAEGDVPAENDLRMLAADPRWRVREGVAMALQRLGDADRERLWQLADHWLDVGEGGSGVLDAGAGGSPDLLLLRAVAAGVAEPRLVKAPADARRALGILDRVTGGLMAVPAPDRRGRDDVRVLRQTLEYAWSVAAVGAPEEGFAALERWAGTGDPDARRIARANATRARLRRLDPARADALAAP